MQKFYSLNLWHCMCGPLVFVSNPPFSPPLVGSKVIKKNCSSQPRGCSEGSVHSSVVTYLQKTLQAENPSGYNKASIFLHPEGRVAGAETRHKICGGGAHSDDTREHYRYSTLYSKIPLRLRLLSYYNPHF